MPSRAAIIEAVRFWEIGRIAFNLVLAAAAIAGIEFIGDGLGALTPGDRLGVALLAAAANAAYLLAYPVDFLFQASGWAPAWRRARVLAWLLGLTAGLFLTGFVIFAMFAGFGDH